MLTVLQLLHLTQCEGHLSTCCVCMYCWMCNWVFYMHVVVYLLREHACLLGDQGVLPNLLLETLSLKTLKA